MVELFTAKERCSLNFLHKLIFKNHIAGLSLRAQNSSCHGDWPWLLSGELCDSRVECWVMSLVLILSLTVGLSLTFVLTGKKSAPKCPTDILWGQDVAVLGQCWTSLNFRYSTLWWPILKWNKACSLANRARLFLVMAKIGRFCNGRKSCWSNGTV